MSAFKSLRDVSKSFEDDLRRASEELFTARIYEPFEDVIFNKLRDLSLHTSKLRFLQAKHLAASQPTTPGDKQTTIDSYSRAVQLKLMEKQEVKYMSQVHAMKAVITASDSTLHPEILERKEKILEQLTIYKGKEDQLRHLVALLQERQQQLEKAMREWDTQLGRLRERRADIEEFNEQENHTSPLTVKLHRLERKISLLKALLASLASSRVGDYDWLADPQRRLRALKLARQ